MFLLRYGGEKTGDHVCLRKLRHEDYGACEFSKEYTEEI